MEVVGLTLSAIALASLFSTCVDCFECYEATRDAAEDLKTILVRLDLGKTRLLIWGDQVGILKTTEQGRSRHLDEHNGSLKDVFGQLRKTLTRSDQSREIYGRMLKTQQDDTIGLIRDDLSRSSKRNFISSWDEFKRKFNPSINPGLRIKWAIAGKRQFEQLIVEVRGLIDGLNQYIEVPRQTVDNIVCREITLVEDLARLRLVEAASEGVYTLWAEKAKTVISQSEAGTLDHREVEEVLQDSNDPPTVSRSAEPDKVTFVNLPNNAKLLFVLTEHCSKSATGRSCNYDTFGVDALSRSTHYLTSDFALEADWRSDWSIGKICFDAIKRDDPEQWLKWETDPNLSQHVGTVLIYCPPCVCQVHTAFSLISSPWRLSSLINVRIRVDDRIHSSCCNEGSPSAKIRNLRDELGNRSSAPARYFDRPWLDQRLEDLDEEDSEEEGSHPPLSEQTAGDHNNPGYEGWPPLLQVIVLGECDPMTTVMRNPPFKREAKMPRANRIYHMGATSVWRRKLLGTFNPRKPLLGGDTVSVRLNGGPSSGVNGISKNEGGKKRKFDDDLN